MDWSSIYDEHGEEEGDWSGWASNRLTPVLDSFSQSGSYSPLICYFFTINYILGVGCLGIPYDTFFFFPFFLTSSFLSFSNLFSMLDMHFIKVVLVLEQF